MAADPRSENAAAERSLRTDGCPACHGLSANGAVFCTADRSFQRHARRHFGRQRRQLAVTDRRLASPTPGAKHVSGWLGGLARLCLGATDTGRQLRPGREQRLGNTTQQLLGIDSSRQVSLPTTAMQSGGGGVGLLAQYYPSTTFSGNPVEADRSAGELRLRRELTESDVPNDYSVRRSGQVQAYFSEDYAFEVVTSDNATLTVGNATSATGTGTVTLSVPMIAGALVPIELDEVNALGNSNVQLYWSSPSTPRALVPQTQLFLPSTEPPHGAAVTYFANDDFTGASLTLLEPDIASNYQTHSPPPGSVSTTGRTPGTRKSNPRSPVRSRCASTRMTPSPLHSTALRWRASAAARPEPSQRAAPRHWCGRQAIRIPCTSNTITTRGARD